MPRAGEDLTTEDYLEEVVRVSPIVAEADPVERAETERFLDALRDLDEITPEGLAHVIGQDPVFVEKLGLACGMGLDRLRGYLKERTGSQSWVTRSRNEPEVIIDAFLEEFPLLDMLEEARFQEFTYADVIIARNLQRRGAAMGVAHGRSTEDAIADILDVVGVNYEREIPIPGLDRKVDFGVYNADEDGWAIVIPVKSMDVTGSKLQDAHSEILTLAEQSSDDVQVIPVLDGLGWHRREGDLRRILGMLRDGMIDGLYRTQDAADFEDHIREIAEDQGLV